MNQVSSLKFKWIDNRKADTHPLWTEGVSRDGSGDCMNEAGVPA